MRIDGGCHCTDCQTLTWVMQLGSVGQLPKQP
jgi:hypothetical protein